MQKDKGREADRYGRKDRRVDSQIHREVDQKISR
jgi:hypothetical protein